jgi:hypothetical protein
VGLVNDETGVVCRGISCLCELPDRTAGVLILRGVAPVCGWAGVSLVYRPAPLVPRLAAVFAALLAQAFPHNVSRSWLVSLHFPSHVG